MVYGSFILLRSDRNYAAWLTERRTVAIILRCLRSSDYCKAAGKNISVNLLGKKDFGAFGMELAAGSSGGGVRAGGGDNPNQRSHHRCTPNEIVILERAFAEGRYPDQNTKSLLSGQTGMTVHQARAEIDKLRPQNIICPICAAALGGANMSHISMISSGFTISSDLCGGSLVKIAIEKLVDHVDLIEEREFVFITYSQIETIDNRRSAADGTDYIMRA
ncbi:hypothetical protein M569_06191 [Genlisea aurea]|uniref:Homeobox domain-containing protein n=1 Tax=Genlisea aurea TaxID=192259 RepID=S8E814_9LAMI|nr:hypothetical protein M569_06191 [Genlisea aurea]